VKQVEELLKEPIVTFEISSSTSEDAIPARLYDAQRQAPLLIPTETTEDVLDKPELVQVVTSR
jgi:hypothetical protein